MATPLRLPGPTPHTCRLKLGIARSVVLDELMNVPQPLKTEIGGLTIGKMESPKKVGSRLV